MEQGNRNYIRTGYILLALGTVAMSWKSIFAKFAFAYGIDAHSLVMLRLYVSTPLFLVALSLVEKRRPTSLKLRHWAVYAGMALSGFLGAMSLSFASIELIDAGLSTLITFSYPTLTILGLACMGAQAISWPLLAALAASGAGLALVLPVSWDQLTEANPGIVLAIAAAATFALFNLFNDRALRIGSSLEAITYAMVLGVIVLTLAHGFPVLPANPAVWGLALLLGIVTGFIPFWAIAEGMKRVGVGQGALISVLGPGFTVLWASIILHENMAPLQWLGMALLLASVAALKLVRAQPVLARKV